MTITVRIGSPTTVFRAVVPDGPVAPSIEESAAFAREIAAAAASRPGATVEIAE